MMLKRSAVRVRYAKTLVNLTRRFPLSRLSRYQQQRNFQQNGLCRTTATDEGREQISFNVDVCYDEVLGGNSTVNNHQKSGRSDDKFLREGQIISDDTDR